MARQRVKKDKIEKRSVQLFSNDGFFKVEIEAKISSAGFIAMEMTSRKRKLAKLIHALAVEMGCNPLDIKLKG